ncbi:hypothetical protein VCRA217O134_10458 [Vibrio crassostreae]|nr:hypothetical protein VCRA217O134_10458 [Vibrio crassostreae]
MVKQLNTPTLSKLSSNYAALGGPNALIDTETSAKGLVTVIESSNTEVSGHFFNFDGTEIDW